MIKPNSLQKNDFVAIVSLSSGILGEKFISHELNLGIKRLKKLGLKTIFMPNSLKGIQYLKNNPQSRAQDLKDAFSNPKIKAIICAIGGDDTYKTLPFLLNDSIFINNVRNNPKIFLGYSDSTINHLMFYKLGLSTFYGQSFLTDFAEMENEMLSYTYQAFLNLFSNKSETKILSSPFWFEERKNFSIDNLFVSRIKHQEKYGHEFINGENIVKGKLLGGCLESIYSFLNNEELKEFEIFPTKKQWKNKILFLETSEIKSTPKKFQKMIAKLEQLGIFNYISCLIVGKPQDEIYYHEYKNILIQQICDKYNLPLVYNLNFGHSYPKTIIPYGLDVLLDFETNQISISESFFQ